MNILKILRDGLLHIADSYTNQREYVRPGHGPQRDQAKLANDVRMVGEDITYIITIHGEQPYQRSSNKQTRRPAFH